MHPSIYLQKWSALFQAQPLTCTEVCVLTGWNGAELVTQRMMDQLQAWDYINTKLDEFVCSDQPHNEASKYPRLYLIYCQTISILFQRRLELESSLGVRSELMQQAMQKFLDIKESLCDYTILCDAKLFAI